MLTELKTAIQKTGRLQWSIAKSAGLTEGRLTRIITERAKATPAERKVLAKLLKESQKELFREINNKEDEKISC